MKTQHHSGTRDWAGGPLSSFPVASQDGQSGATHRHDGDATRCRDRFGPCGRETDGRQFLGEPYPMESREASSQSEQRHLERRRERARRNHGVLSG